MNSYEELNMDISELMRSRHSVRKFKDRPLDVDAVAALNREIASCNEESGLDIRLVTDEPEAFRAGKTHYGQFRGCKNYLALVGPVNRDEIIGYYGERIVLKAQELGINSCWVALTYKKGKAEVSLAPGEKRYLVVELGYGVAQGPAHKSKEPAAVSNMTDASPEWFKKGIEAALLAPTAMNQQKFRFELSGDKVKAKAGLSFYTKIDLGIAKYHFELGSGKGQEIWA